MVVSTSAFDCLERLVSKMTRYVSSWILNPTHSLLLTGELITKAIIKLVYYENELLLLVLAV